MNEEKKVGNYSILIEKLDHFIRKYYRNRLLKGLIFFAAISLFSFLVVITLEYFGHFDPAARTILFYLFILSTLAVLVYYIIVPALKIRKIGKVISYEQAAQIIGNHFPEVRDKLLNTLQLNQLFQHAPEEVELVKASIVQKTKQLTPIPFSSAIILRKNRKFLKYAIPPLAILILLTFIYPSFITHPTSRIIHYSTAYVEQAPYRFVIRNRKLEAFQQEDFTLKVGIEGDYAPQEVYLDADGVQYKLMKESTVLFAYTFRTLQKTLTFRLTDGKTTSGDYILKVYPRPTILNFDADLIYPPYTGRKNETLENTGDLIIPEGTKVTWRFFTKDVSGIRMQFPEGMVNLASKEGNSFLYSTAFSKSSRYCIQAVNGYIVKPDSLVYSVTVIPDNYPVITATETVDSAMPGWKFFKGVIKDDYGFSRLTFSYLLYVNGDTSDKVTSVENIPFDKALNQQSFYYSFELSKILRNPGDALEFYFETCDNDALHGAKCARTETFRFRAPTAEEVEKMTSETEKNITSNLKSLAKEAQAVQQQLDEYTRKMVDKNSLSWQDKKQLEDLLENEKDLENKLNQIQQKNEEKNNLEEQYNQADSSILDKQKKLNDLFNQIMDEDTKKLLQQLKDMLDKMDKSQLQNILEKMKFSNQDLEKQLDRSLELFKQLQFDKDLAQAIDNLKKLSEDQNKLAEQTDNKDSKNEKLTEEQQKLNEKFDQLKKDIDALEKENKDLEQPNNFPNTGQDQQSISDEMNKSKEALQQNKRKDASRSQQKSSEGLNNLSQKLSDMQQEMESDQFSEDTQKLREILENLVTLSFDQEDLMTQTKQINRNDPRYINLIQRQNDLKDDLGMVEDSLYQLAKRQVMIKPFIMREISSINKNVEDIVKDLNKRSIPTAATKQQLVMTSINNLALLLSEALKQMEEQMNALTSQKQGNSSCNKGGSGGSKQSMKSMRQAQQSLNQKLQQLKKEMESKSMNGQSKPIQQGGQNMSEQLARMAAEQEAIRNEMKKYQDQLNEQGTKTDNSLNDAMSKMEQTEKDLINKKILEETVKRQQEIVTRMLESEKAEQQRDQEEKRQSTEAKNPLISNPSQNLQYNNMQKQSTDILRTVQAPYNYFYKSKINMYLLKFEK